MENIKDFFIACVACLLVFWLVVLFMLCILTPEKDKFGQYTQPLKYWTSEEYFQARF